MIEITLRLRQTDQPQRQAAAWLIAGDNPHIWLNELSIWQIPLDQLRLYVVPRSAADRSPRGVLVLAPTDATPAKTRRAEGYGKCAPRLYVPATARLDPPASEAEIDAALPNDLAVWHPNAGLVGFADDEGITVGDLIEPPCERSTGWDGARPGTAFPPRLVAVLPPAPPPVEQALADWRDDIGSEAPDQLPPAPREPSESPLARLGRAATLAAATLAQKLTALAPRTARAPTWVNALENWAAHQVARLSSGLDAARRKEINRLLHLLETDPDRGLRHALPLDVGGHRGEGSPGSRLPSRNINFRLDHLGGGSPADPWQIEAQQRFVLQRRYRELANREVQLGRHRRAAYIFAELLGDLAAAASALEQGGHDREAAVLYRDRLGRPLEAARCLERCGGWDEAIDIYVGREEFEKAAEILTRLERSDEATRMYRLAVERWTESGDRLRAAALLEEKLAAVEEAVQLLASSWPSSPQAPACLAKLFELLGRHARHKEASRWIVRLRDEQSVQVGRTVEVLATVAQTYPNPVARHEAADATRVLVGKRLPRAQAVEAGSLVRAVRSLVPQDDLLGRDAARWLARLGRPSAPPKPKYQRQATIVETGRFRLPADVTYKAAVLMKDGLIAAGFTSRGVAAVRASFSEFIDRVDWECYVRQRWVPLAGLEPLLLAAHEDSRAVNLALIGHRPLEFRQLSYGPKDETGAIHIWTQPWFTPETLAVAFSSAGVWWSIDDHLLLTGFRSDGTQMSSRQFSLAELGVRFEPRDNAPERLAVMLARREDVYLGIGHTLVKIKSDRVEQTPLKGWVRRLVAAPLVLQLRVAVGFEDGVAVMWDDLNGRDVLEIADDLGRPELTFTLDGLLVAVNSHEGRIYATSNRSVTLRGRFDGPRRPIAAAVCGERPGEFAVLTEDGELRRYRVT